MLDIERKKQELFEFYAQFEKVAQPYLCSAVCRKGCADCCITVGNVDITTLEGIIIVKHLLSLPQATQKLLNKRLALNRRTKRESKYARCAFLQEDNACTIYNLRPFSCRRLYSIRVCGKTGPTVHRQVWEAAEKITSAIQALDETGCSGHMSYIIALLNDLQFRKAYLKGEFPPGDIHDYARQYNVVINR